MRRFCSRSGKIMVKNLLNYCVVVETRDVFDEGKIIVLAKKYM